MSSGSPSPATRTEGAAQAAPPFTRAMRRIIAWICAIILMSMMLVTVLDVIGRYLLNRPLTGATEITELLLSAVVFIGLPAATLDREHVTVDFLTERLPSAIERIRAPVIAVASGVILVVIAWRLWVMGDQIGGYGGTTATLALPVAPFAYLAALLTGVSAIIMLGAAVNTVWRR